jgi:NTP pyrophosphatase (non-canonical NTP hydrolase)
MLAREATKADIQAVRDRLREAKEQRQLDIQINQAIALVNRNHRRKKYDTERLSAGPGDLPPEKLLLNGLMGLNGEAGEAIDILKKHLFQGHELDTAHMAKELGDVAWYLAVSANAIGYDLETIMQMNVDKLKARYPDGFDAEHSLHRNQDDI